MRKTLAAKVIMLVALAALVFVPQVIGQNSKNYMEQGGSKWDIGGYLYLLDGGILTVNSGGSVVFASGSALDLSGATVTGGLTITGVTANYHDINTLTGMYAAAGTATASKALVADANIDVSGVRYFTLTNLYGGASTLGLYGKAGSSGAGGIVALAGGVGDTAAAGGAVTLTGGAGTTTGAGGNISVTGGASGAGATGNSGTATLAGGTALSTAGTGGNAYVLGGYGKASSGTGVGGSVYITAGQSGGGSTGNGGALALAGGAAASTLGNGGAVTIYGGAGTSTGTNGSVTIDSGTGGSTATTNKVIIGPANATGGVEIGASSTVGTTVKGTLTLGSTALTATGTELNVLHSATATTADITALHGAATTMTYVIAQGTTNTATITITVKDSAGSAIAYPGVIDIWLAAASTGIGLGSAPSTGITAGASGTVLAPHSNKLHYRCLTSAVGVFVASLLDTNKYTSYVCVSVDHGMGPICTRQLASGDFG